MAERTVLVVDTSVIVKWFSGEELTDAALRLRQSYVDNKIEIFVPDLLLYELSNALRYNPVFDVDDVRRAVESVLAMDFQIVTPAPDLLADAIGIAHELALTVYDAVYVALADALDARVVTTDDEIVDVERGVGLSTF